MDDIKALEAGRQAGTNFGAWIFDGTTDETTIRAVIKGYEDGDPVIMDMAPSPLSGEWAGESISDLSYVYDVDLKVEANADAFEEGYFEGFWAEVIRSGKAMLGEEEDDIKATTWTWRENEKIFTGDRPSDYEREAHP